jgi:hypothetical protein
MDVPIGYHLEKRGCRGDRHPASGMAFDVSQIQTLLLTGSSLLAAPHNRNRNWHLRSGRSGPSGGGPSGRHVCSSVPRPQICLDRWELGIPRRARRYSSRLLPRSGLWRRTLFPAPLITRELPKRLQGAAGLFSAPVGIGTSGRTLVGPSLTAQPWLNSHLKQQRVRTERKLRHSTLILILPSTDQTIVKPLFTLALGATLAIAEPHPNRPQSTDAPQLSTGPAQPSDPVRFEITHVEASQPQIIRIFNLDEGTREIEMIHVAASHPQIIRILNLDEGTLDIVLPLVP